MSETNTEPAAPAPDVAGAPRAIRWERDVLVYELIRQEHEALRWENPRQPPEWTQRIRGVINLPWVGDCSTCSSSPARFLRDRGTWPDLHGWTPSDLDVDEGAFLTGKDAETVRSAPFLPTVRRTILEAQGADPS